MSWDVSCFSLSLHETQGQALSRSCFTACGAQSKLSHGSSRPAGETLPGAAVRGSKHGAYALSSSFAHSGAGRLEEAIMCLTPGGTGFAAPSTSWWRSI